MDWHWESCPACGAKGYRERMLYSTGGSGSPAVINESCAVCDGLGRVRVANGWHLAADPVTVTVTMTPTTVVLDPVV